MEDNNIFLKAKKMFNKAKKIAFITIFVIGLITIISIILILRSYFSQIFAKNNQSNDPSVITESSLKEIIDVSDLSTYQAIYNSYCTVYNTENPEEINYRVAYNSKIDIGIDFSLVKFIIDDKQKVVTMILPEPEILDTQIDISNLDFLFESKKSDVLTVSGEAYNACISDVTEKVASNNLIYEIARQNAENACVALVKPFIEQLSNPYELVASER